MLSLGDDDDAAPPPFPNGRKQRGGWYFSPVVTLGNILQGCAVLIAVLGAFFGGYLSLKGEIYNLNTRYTIVTQRLDYDEANFNALHTEFIQAIKDQRNRLDQIIQNIADLRATVAGQRPADRPR